MPRKRKKAAVPALTAEELRLLLHPPTPATWRCPTTIPVTAFGKVVHQACGINSGSALTCWLCTQPAPESPNLVWPAYEVACAKAGISPELRQRWSPSLAAKAAAKAEEAKSATPGRKRSGKAAKRAKAKA